MSLMNTATSLATSAISGSVPAGVKSLLSSSYKVEIECQGKKVIFEASVPIGESRSANYDGYSIVHLPTDIFSYRNTGSRRFGINFKLVSRNEKEADKNAEYVNLIRAWIEPDFGDSGATPPILKLTAYRNDNIKKVQCILKAYNFSFPDDVDWIHTSKVPMPVILSGNVELDEAYSPEQITKKEWKIKGLPKPGLSLGNLPSVSDLTNISNISGASGLANFDLGLGSSLGGIMGGSMNPTAMMGSAMSGFDQLKNNLPSASGIINSPLISENVSTLTNFSNSPLLTGFNPESLVKDTITNISPSIQNIGNKFADTFQRSTNFEVTTPTEI